MLTPEGFMAMEYFTGRTRKDGQMKPVIDSPEGLKEAFTYHAPFGKQTDQYESIRFHALEFGKLLCAYCPQSPELTLSLRKLQESVMWANASIAINGYEVQGGIKET